MDFPVTFFKYPFKEHTGYFIDPDSLGAEHALVAMRHSALEQPWSDTCVHLHRQSEEFFLLLQGELRLLVLDTVITLRPHEILMVRPGFPHAIVGGEGLIEHLGFRAPALQDKQVTGDIPQLPPISQEKERELRCDWGYRIPLTAERNQNCWLFGLDKVRFPSPQVTFAYMSYRTYEEANAGIGTRHRPHRHLKSWEYYGVFSGTKTLEIEDTLVTIEPGEILCVPPGICHSLYSTQTPHEGFTLRVPVELDDKILCEE
jgi:mannose-6-phosphate isomerase-like protein (cupin superfamily)